MADGLSLREQRELAQLLLEQERREAQRDVAAAAQWILGLPPARHHIILAALLDRWLDVNSGLDRLAVFMPPRHAKSLYGSLVAPVSVIGRYPGSRLMHIGHTQRLVDRFGRAIRNVVNDPRRNPFRGIAIEGDSKAKAEWAASNGSSYVAFGLNSHPSGNPADWLFVDDPISGSEEANSQVQRDNVWELFLGDVWSRLEGPQKQLWMLTRWHQDDPMGRILPPDFAGRSGWYSDRETGQRWYVLSLPAVCEHDNDPCGREIGEWLWPELHGPESAAGAARKRAETGSNLWAKMLWSALYQQRPSPAEGLFFSLDDLRYYDPAKQGPQWTRRLTVYGASDYAVATPVGSSDPDWTVHGVFGVDEDMNVYVLDWWRGRKTSDVWLEAWLNLVERWRPVVWADEAGQIEKGVGPFRKQRQREEIKKGRRVACATRAFTSSTSKEQRAAAIAGMIGMHRLMLPKDAPWVPALESEIAGFPTGAHDDQVDVLSLFARLLDVVTAGRQPPRRPENPRPNTLDAMWDDLAEDDA